MSAPITINATATLIDERRILVAVLNDDCVDDKFPKDQVSKPAA